MALKACGLTCFLALQNIEAIPMKTQEYTRLQALSLIPLLSGITAEISDRQQKVAAIESMICALRPTAHVHKDDISHNQSDLARQRMELRRAANELDRLGCALAITDPLEIFIPGVDENFGWRPGETFLRQAAIEPFAA
jgi:hypothetical protein